MASLARNYNLPYGKRFIDFDEPEYDKRNLQSLMRNSGKRYYDEDPSYFDEYKRNMASIAREMSSRYIGKRNVAALLRQDSYLSNGEEKTEDGLQAPKTGDQAGENESEKRSIASLKAQMKNSRKFKRDKRQVDYSWQNEEYPVPVYQNNNVYDYEELIRALTGQYPNTEKRFLGKFSNLF